MLKFENYGDVVALGFEALVEKARKTALARVVKMTEPFQCVTMEGLVEGQAGDYLAIGVKDEVYPIAAAVFEASYEIVSDESEKEGTARDGGTVTEGTIKSLQSAYNAVVVALNATLKVCSVDNAYRNSELVSILNNIAGMIASFRNDDPSDPGLAETFYDPDDEDYLPF